MSFFVSSARRNVSIVLVQFPEALVDMRSYCATLCVYPHTVLSKHWGFLLIQPEPRFSLLVCVCIVTVLFNTIGHKPPGKKHRSFRSFRLCTGPRGRRQEPTTTVGIIFPAGRSARDEASPRGRAPIRVDPLETGGGVGSSGKRNPESVSPKEPNFNRGSGCVTLTSHFSATMGRGAHELKWIPL